ncbi:MAG: hypothetical protein ACM3VX_07645 [Bacteroidota bacterium]
MKSPIEESLLYKKVYGALTGGALGDAMGAPIEGGLVNACNPQAAYREATSVAAINTHSYGLEGAAVLAAGIAEAMRPDADRDSVFIAALAVAHGGTKQALTEVV